MPVQWLVVGLGNPEKKYDLTRHNIGFRVLDSFGFSFLKEKKYEALVAKDGDALYCKPLTYMNLSGVAVQHIAHYYHIDPKKIIVIYDDKEIPFGTIRLRSEGSSGGHNGVQSIIESLGCNTFARIRVGVGITPEYMDAADFVLSRFTIEEEENIPHIILASTTCVQEILLHGLTKTNHKDIQVVSNAQTQEGESKK